jgi:mannose-6-phosphate isomerase-like protein (cupin superfamily)
MESNVSRSLDDQLQTRMKPAYASQANVRFNPGRRADIRYRDLFVQAATNGRMRAEVMHAENASTRPTGWHYHTCEIQFLYAIRGWVEMEIDGLGRVLIAEGESIMIPGHTVHQELQSSPNMELLEISLPASLGTVNCDPPDVVGTTDQRP